MKYILITLLILITNLYSITLTVDSPTTNEDTDATITYSTVDDNGTVNITIVSHGRGSCTVNNDGTITYSPAANDNGTDTVRVKAQDDDSSDEKDSTITIDAVNDKPTISTNELSVTEDGQTVITSSEIEATDIDSDDASLTFRVISTAGGHFEKSGGTVTTFSTSEISNNEIIFKHTGGETDAAYDLVANDGSLDSTQSSANPTETIGVNDAPTLINKTVPITEGATVTITDSMIKATDPDIVNASGNESNTITFTVSDVTYGRFELSSDAGTPITTFTAANIAAGVVRFVHDGGEDDTTFSIIGNDGVVDTVGGVESATINFTEANDPLTGSVTITAIDPNAVDFAREDETLVADTSSDQIEDEDMPISAFSYQWKADGVNITGATEDRYKLLAVEVGKRITVKVSYVDINGRTESTTSAQTDRVTGDLDGYSSDMENEIPSFGGSDKGDGNNDGRQDSLQANVSSGRMSSSVSSNHWFTVFSKNGADDIKHTKVENSVTPSDISDNIAMIAGLFTIELKGITNGGTATVELYVPYHPDYNGYLKYNNITSQWDNLAGVTITHYEKDSRTRFEFSIVDGGPYDSDGAANGIILDPGGPVFVGVANAPISTKAYLFLILALFAVATYGHRREKVA